ncbi:MAG: hypothetical protein JO147_05995 [Actinobacteria bacterium]|nr:hypothetical protein [Actinomycetota bacterium]
MAFIQIIEAQAADIDRLQALDREWQSATEGKRTARRVIITQDRNNPGRHLIFVFFDSYDSAMDNSKLPETQEFAEKFASAADSMSFHDLDVLDDRDL